MIAGCLMTLWDERAVEDLRLIAADSPPWAPLSLRQRGDPGQLSRDRIVILDAGRLMAEGVVTR